MFAISFTHAHMQTIASLSFFVLLWRIFFVLNLFNDIPSVPCDKVIKNENECVRK